MRQSRWMKLFSEYGFKAKYHLGKENVVVESWSRKKSEAKNEFWIDDANGDVKFTAMPFGVTNAPAVFMELMNERGVSEGREDVREVFQQCGSRAKRKLSRCGRNQMGNEPILALPEGADDFVVYYDARSKDLEACLENGEESRKLPTAELFDVDTRRISIRHCEY
ncbi:hypothetical protein Tco_0952638 [Tanacetum coccineum]|uniref:Reverse transcriptase n=1 Tax=Tanacetum coccineum TaxID=301880 RepID=A0ABQ5DZF7_9ASTR